ncbi:resolvase [Burkholderia ubonensis]|uniref:recombinase family protein n=1 Tax=Burkholderia ubonensis TaxID=101571 RepID=UPI00075E7119|nr:recombinase family protein [Burkholderia ubonensis]KVG35102.1 resolvase [Burkholderia ubonensis]KVU63695.1 resolvase [Burkholderia ubonensis]KVZ19003.1 resolvase [Burkholderia ubonensis]KWB56039.1 resolvase [Burkholderia ubonensis]KWE97114.1 resolvase [Burkholderia ubonensis]
MASQKFVTYFRVSTQRQGISGLGILAQREAVTNYLKGINGAEVVAEFEEHETGKGSNALAKRPQLAAALALCKKTGAALLVGKLDRLSRNVRFISELMESRVRFVACDLPEANELTLHMMAAFAQYEAQRISERTRDALRAAKARGVLLGTTGATNLKPNIEKRQKEADRFALELAPVINGFRAQGMSQRKMVDALNRLNIRAVRGGQWSLLQLQHLLKRIDAQQGRVLINSGVVALAA